MKDAYRVSERIEGALFSSIEVATVFNDTISIGETQTSRRIISQMLASEVDNLVSEHERTPLSD
jgi:hypothetical protein